MLFIRLSDLWTFHADPSGAHLWECDPLERNGWLDKEGTLYWDWWFITFLVVSWITRKCCMTWVYTRKSRTSHTGDEMIDMLIRSCLIFEVFPVDLWILKSRVSHWSGTILKVSVAFIWQKDQKVEENEIKRVFTPWLLFTVKFCEVTL